MMSCERDWLKARPDSPDRSTLVLAEEEESLERHTASTNVERLGLYVLRDQSLLVRRRGAKR